MDFHSDYGDLDPSGCFPYLTREASSGGSSCLGIHFFYSRTVVQFLIDSGYRVLLFLQLQELNSSRVTPDRSLPYLTFFVTFFFFCALF
ncbi:hypothetical protein ADUPG1_011067 [Aduncisulcus paluster]|uniref:Uncharacterized protein n=2 Tax=Aduncisulcus paluster TaxID=2918883 RepID=A0ABQ5JU80_9EUKA|nr:hypothetical protein ADUPG1_011067 [Aduncisulcus paluster]